MAPILSRVPLLHGRTGSPRLQDLAHMLGLWRLDWPGNTIDAGEVVNLENVLDPGTGDMYRVSPSYQAAYEATGWGGAFPSMQISGADATSYQAAGLPAYSNNGEATLISATQSLDGSGSGDWIGGIHNGASYQIAMARHNSDYAMWRNAGTSKYVDDGILGANLCITVMSFNGSTCNIWKNDGVKVTDGDLSGSVGGSCTYAQIGTLGASHAFRYSLFGIYDEVFDAAMAHLAFEIITASFPIA